MAVFCSLTESPCLARGPVLKCHSHVEVAHHTAEPGALVSYFVTVFVPLTFLETFSFLLDLPLSRLLGSWSCWDHRASRNEPFPERAARRADGASQTCHPGLSAILGSPFSAFRAQPRFSRAHLCPFLGFLLRSAGADPQVPPRGRARGGPLSQPSAGCLHLDASGGRDGAAHCCQEAL